MKINGVNNLAKTNFSAIYHYKLDVNNDDLTTEFTKNYYRFCKTKAGKNLAIVTQAPFHSSTVKSLNSTLLPKNLSAGWLSLHFGYLGEELPEPLATNILDVFIFSDQDAKDYKKFEKKISSFSSIIKDRVGIFNQRNKTADTVTDAKLLSTVDYYKLQLERFKGFLEGKSIQELDLNEVFKSRGL